MSKSVRDVSSDAAELSDVDDARTGGDVAASGVSDVEAAITDGNGKACGVSSEDDDDEDFVDFFFFLDADGIVGASRGS